MVDILILFQEDGEDVATRLAWAAAERGYSVWGDPSHFKDASDQELEAAAKAARCVMLLWSKQMIADAGRRGGVYANMDARRVCAAILQPGLEPPAPWRDRPNDDLSNALQTPQAVTLFLERSLRAAGAPSDQRQNVAAVDRLREAEEDAAAWRAVRGSDGTEGAEAYLRRFGHRGLFSALAKRRKAEAAKSAANASLAAPADEGPTVIGAGATPLAAPVADAAAEPAPLARNPLLLVATGAAAASILFGGLALMTGGDLRRLDGGPSQEALALQSAEEMGADLSAELEEARRALALSEEALSTRNEAIAEMEIALAEAEALAAQSGAGASERQAAAQRQRADLQSRLANSARERAALERKVSEQERALRTLSTRLQRAETELSQSRNAQSKTETEQAETMAELQASLEASEAEARRANAILDAARRRIEALETERAALRSASGDGVAQGDAGVRQLPARLATQQETAEPDALAIAEPVPAAAAAPAQELARFEPDPDSAAPASAPLPQPRP